MAILKTVRVPQSRPEIIKMGKRSKVKQDVSFFFPLRFYLFIFRERRREGERDGEKH